MNPSSRFASKQLLDLKQICLDSQEILGPGERGGRNASTKSRNR